MSLAVQENILRENPFKYLSFKSHESDRMYLEPAELDKLWDLYKKNLYPENLQKVLRMYLFSCFTGARLSDLKTLRHDHIIGDKLVFQPQKQRSKMVRVPLIPAALQLIRDTGEHRIKGILFEHYSEKVMRAHLRTIADLAGIPKKITFHSGRHTFATMFLRETKNIKALQELLGHTNIKDTMIYAHILGEDIEADMQKFGSRF
jgi:integrase